MTDSPSPPLPSGPLAPGAAAAADGATVPGAVAPPILNQPFDGDSLYALRAALAAHGAEAGLAPQRVLDLVSAVHELAANAICHGAGHGRLRVWERDGMLQCQITDDGTPADLPGGAPAGWPIEHGHGLWLARELADQLSLRTGPGGSVATVGFALDAGAA
jgi:anti-sigma regulatory factor (Ser/Thr protein kinase)